MARSPVLKEKPPKRSITIRNVPSEVADMFSELADLSAPLDEYGKHTIGELKTQFFIALVKSKSADQIGEERTNKKLDRYRRRREDWNEVVKSAKSKNTPKSNPS